MSPRSRGIRKQVGFQGLTFGRGNETLRVGRSQEDEADLHSAKLRLIRLIQVHRAREAQTAGVRKSATSAVYTLVERQHIVRVNLFFLTQLVTTAGVCPAQNQSRVGRESLDSAQIELGAAATF
jgi:hypothetical protein